MKKLFTSFITFLVFYSAYSQEFELVEFATGFSNPLGIVNAGDERLFVVNQDGIINIVNEDGTVETESFLNIETLIDYNLGEDGLLGLVFHPNYLDNGWFFINYINLEGNTVIARYEVSENPNIANPNGTIILEIDQPTLYHNGGDMHFGPDGYLWIAVGDGGNAGEPEENGIFSQDINSLLGKILRILVTEEGYTCPPDNPFVGIEGKDEIWAYGLRNPWKFSFDEANGEIWISDVGSFLFEEINRNSLLEAGLNYGWPCFEGYNELPNSICDGSEIISFPDFYYEYGNGRCSITGGYVYRGSMFPELYGKYFFADYCSREIGWIDENDNLEFLLAYPEYRFTAFGKDINGEIYVASRNEGEDKILKIIGDSFGLNDLDKITISVNPNPTSDFVNITSNKPIDAVSIYSAEGKLIQKLNGNATQIDISRYPKGIYMVTVRSGNVSKTQKVVKK